MEIAVYLAQAGVPRPVQRVLRGRGRNGYSTPRGISAPSLPVKEDGLTQADNDNDPNVSQGPSVTSRRGPYSGPAPLPSASARGGRFIAARSPVVDPNRWRRMSRPIVQTRELTAKKALLFKNTGLDVLSGVVFCQEERT